MHASCNQHLTNALHMHTLQSLHNRSCLALAIAGGLTLRLLLLSLL
jgi:hypothetical protein